VSDAATETTVPLRAKTEEEARQWYQSLVAAIRLAKAAVAEVEGPSYSPFAGGRC
jgi:hypothetical protein